MRLSGSDHLGDAISEIGRPEWFRHEVVRAALLSLHSDLRLCMGGEDEDFCVPGCVIGAKATQHLPAVHTRQADVQHDGGGESLPRSLQTGHSIGGADDVQAQFAKAYLDEATNTRRVFNNEY